MQGEGSGKIMAEKKIQVIPGGTSGMGLATAKIVSKYGPVLIGGRNEKRLENALAELKAAGVEAYGMRCDISDRESIDAFAAYAASLGQIDNVINAAAVDAGGPDLILNVNVGGTVNVTEAFLPYMNDTKLIHFSSITGYFYMPDAEEKEIWNNPNDSDLVEKIKATLESKDIPAGMAHMGIDYLYYSASKAFTIYYTKANTARFGKRNSQIFSIAPGAFDTPMLREQNDPAAIDKIAAVSAYGRLGEADEMANFIGHLLEPGHKCLTGADLVLDSGKMAMSTVKQLA